MKNNTKNIQKGITAILFVAMMVLSIFSGVALADNSDRSNAIPPDFQNRKSSSEVQDTMPMVSNSLSVNSLDVKAPSTLAIDETLADMIDNYAPDYYQDFWNVSLSQYKAWIALITLREAGIGRYAAHSQYGDGFDGDRFNHVDAGPDFRFSTGIGAFQLDNYGSQGDANEDWTTMSTIDKLDPEKSLLSVLRWHRDRFGDSDRWDGATLANFSQYSAWNAVKPSKEGDFTANWNTISGHTWDECKNTKLDVNFDPPTVTDPLENNVKYIGSVYWDLWDACSDTWLITARSWEGNVVTKYYYTLNDTGWEMWVWNDPDHKFIYRFARHYTTTQFPEDRIDTGGIADAGTTDDEAALNLTKPCFSLDLIFTIDTTGSMWDDIDEVKASASAIVDEIDASMSNYRIAVVAYRDFPVSPYGSPGDYPFKDVLPFSTDKSSIVAAVQGLIVGGGADWRESVYSALIHSIDSTSLGGWRGSDQAAKAIILMGDAPPHDPEPFTGYTLSSVVTAAELADPVIIYPIQIGGTVEKFEDLADQTGGKVFTAENADEVVDTVLDMIEEIATYPVAEAGPGQTVYVDDTVTLDGSGSFDPDGTIVLYEWDAEGDGIYEWKSSTTGITTHVYDTVGTYQATLRVTDNDGLQDTDFAVITVEVLINQPPNVDDAYPSIDCLWPPNHKFVDITIEGVTDPDGDVVTITVTGITSDEPTASIEGAGGAEHAPDADGVGTDTASLRAERSGNEDGRVYEITFVASDGIAKTAGSVLVKVPHDQSGDCVSIDSGQNYDATEIN
jgi:hypothetical protein